MHGHDEHQSDQRFPAVREKEYQGVTKGGKEKEASGLFEMFFSAGKKKKKKRKV